MEDRRDGRALSPKEKLAAFFTGNLYPVLIAVLVFLGHAFAIEFYLNFIVVGSVIASLCLCDTVRPLIVALCTYTYQISIEKTPATPTFSDYYFTEWRPYAIFPLFVLCAAALVYCFVKNRFVTRRALSSLPLLIPFGALSLAFLLNGAFCAEWRIESLLYGALQIVVFFLILYIFLLGFKNEKPSELLDYFIYVTAIIALLLIAQVLHRYITADSLILGGSVDKEQMVLGWGIWTIVGIEQAVLIPVLFLGVMRRSGYKSYLYLALACLCYLSTIMSMARNSMVFGTLALVVCASLCMFFGNVKRAARIAVPAVALLAVAAVIFLREPIFKILSEYIKFGFSDNGRFDLWKYGIKAFSENPIFGKGFFGLDTDTFQAVGFYPQMLHNTPIQLLASMGIVGLGAYAYYRAMSLRPFLKKPNINKTMLGLSMLVLILSGLLDNMMFYIQPMFYYAVTEAILYKVNEEDAPLGIG